MVQPGNPWDILSRNFNTHLKENEIDPIAADNIIISWSPILNVISKKYHKRKNIRVLDFGCGTGGFCNKLAKLGFDVVGIDPSIEMIKIARKVSPPNITYILGNQTSLPLPNKFHVIVSLMTFQFINNIDETIVKLSKSLQNNGLLIFSVFNIEWVKACLTAKTPFSFADFKSNDNPTNGWKLYKGGIRIPVYNRSVQEYDEMIIKKGFKKIIEDYPPFTEEFVKTYSYTKPSSVSEFLILGYKKI